MSSCMLWGEEVLMARHAAVQQHFSILIPGTLVLYPISFLIEADCIRSAFWCLISPWQIAEMKAANTFKQHSPAAVAPRCTYTAGLGGLGELCSPRSVSQSIWLLSTELKFTFVLKNSSPESVGLCYSITLTLSSQLCLCAVYFTKDYFSIVAKHCEAPYI